MWIIIWALFILVGYYLTDRFDLGWKFFYWHHPELKGKWKGRWLSEEARHNHYVRGKE